MNCLYQFYLGLTRKVMSELANKNRRAAVMR